MNDQTRPAVGSAIALPSDPMQLMALAEKLAMARLIPPHFQKSPADCWLVMSFCRNRNLDFLMVVGECSVVKGRLFFSGKLTAALLNTSGYLAERLNYEYASDGQSVIVTGRLNNETSPRTVLVKLQDVKTDNAVWKTQPEQQLAYAGARIWGRRHVPEVLMGLLFEGEQPIIDVTPTAVEPRELTDAENARNELMKADAAREAYEARKARDEAASAPPVDEAEPHEVERDDDGERAWSAWATQLIAFIRTASTAQRIDEWIVANSDQFEALKHYDTGKFNRLRHMIQAVQDAKMKAAQDGSR